MPAKHARLSPSAAERWLECPASIRMEGTVPPEQESSYASEGTAAHALAEIKARLAFGQITAEQAKRARNGWIKEWKNLTTEQVEEMEGHTDSYVELIKAKVAEHPGSQVMFEQRMDTGVPTCWGTSDTVIVSMTHVEIVDFKYGTGVRVDAEHNPQLRLYGLGALDTFADLLGDTQEIHITVHQPRLDHTSTEILTPKELRDWRESILPIAAEALSDDAHFSPTEEACRWCPASGRCKAQLEAVFADDAVVEKPREDLSPEEISEYLEKVPLVRVWLKAFEEAALTKAYSEGVHIPGWKVIMSGGSRSVSDAEGLLKYLRSEGFTDNQITNTKPKGIGDLEKLLGAKRVLDDLKPYITKSPGKPSLVHEDAKGDPINPDGEAAKEFKE